MTSEVRDNSHSTGYSIAYTYDHNQNRTSKTIGGVTDSYSYDSHDKLTSTSSKSYGYDNDGNCTSVTVGSNTTSLTYDDSDRVTGITYPSSATNSFVYNGESLRVSKTDSAGTSAVITDGTAPASPVLKDARAVYTPGLSERASGTSKFYHGDALGSTRGITNSSQTVTDAVLYDAFGMTVSRTGSTATPFGFVGAQQYQSDADSGLQLLGHRYYDPSIGRFISSDPAKDGANWYSYGGNNGVINTDAQGLWQPPAWFMKLKRLVQLVAVLLDGGNHPIPVPVPAEPGSRISYPEPIEAPPASPVGIGGGPRPPRWPIPPVEPPLQPPYNGPFRPRPSGPPLEGPIGWGGRGTGSGGGMAAPGTVLEGGGALAGGMSPVLKWKSYAQTGLDQVDDGSPSADPPDQAGYRHNTPIL